MRRPASSRAELASDGCKLSERGASPVMKIVLAVASGGGHWEQLMLLRGAFSQHKVVYVTTLDGLAAKERLAHHILVADCNRDQPMRVLRSGAGLLRVMLTIRPDIVISTGALPGLLALMLGRALGKRTIWVDSVANADEFSLAGLKARKYADLWLSQWEHVAAGVGAEFAGSVI